MNLFKIVLLSLLCFGCNAKVVAPIENNEVTAQNFISGIKIADGENWGNPMNLDFRELIIKGGRPIGHVDYVGVSFLKESPLYKDNVLLITVQMLIEKSLFESREYTLKAKKIIKKGIRSNVDFKAIEAKIGARIKGSKLYDCSIFYHISLKELAEIYSCKIENNGKEDVLLSPILTKEINEIMGNLYMKTIQKGKAATGVFSSDVRF